MPERIRFHLDEHIDPDVSRALRRFGVNVTTTQESGLRTRPDEDQWSFAMKEQRMLVTCDPDFLRRAAQDRQHFGIAFCPHGQPPLRRIVHGLLLIYQVLTPEEIRGHVEYI